MKHELLDVSKWTRAYNDHRHPFWWGIVGLIVVEATVVATFLASFFYLWIVNVAENRSGWPPSSLDQPPLLYPTINTILLLVCGWSMYYGGIVMDRGKAMAFVWCAVLCCGCAGVILYLRWLQFLAFPFRWDENAYASFFWLLTGFHFIHVASALIGTAIIGWFAYKGFYTKDSFLAVQVDTLYWYFVVAGWLPIYFVLYFASGGYL